MNWKGWDVFWGILIVILFFSAYTSLVNYIFLVPSCFSISGDTGDWIAYNGSVLGALISIGVIAFTLRQNKILHEELKKEQNKKHEELKKLQIKSTNYVAKKERIDTISEELFNIYQSTNSSKLVNLINIIIEESSEKERINAKNYYLKCLQESTQINHRLIFLSGIYSDVIAFTEITKKYAICYKKYSLLLRDIWKSNTIDNYVNSDDFTERIIDLDQSAEYKQLFDLIIEQIKKAKENITEELYS
jgi:hypothetical protein